MRSKLARAVAVEPMTRGRDGAPDPPRLGRLTLLEALRRQLPIALIPIVILVAIAVALAYAREPEYESEARINVGGLNLTAQTIESYTAAVTQLANAYARSIHATDVVNPVAEELRVPPGEVIDNVDATPIQGSSVVRIVATWDSADGARRLADASTDSLVDYATKLNAGQETASRLLVRFQRASRRLERARNALARAGANGSARNALETRVATAQLEKETAGFLYQQSQVGQAATRLVQKLAPASEATSDRRDRLEEYVAAALIAGTLIGLGLAVARANAIARRRLGTR